MRLPNDNNLAIFATSTLPHYGDWLRIPLSTTGLVANTTSPPPQQGYRLSNLPPEKEVSLVLRADRQMSPDLDRAAPPRAGAQAVPDRPPQTGDGNSGRASSFGGLFDPVTAISLGMTGVALVTGFGWLLERRRRIESCTANQAPATAVSNDSEASESKSVAGPKERKSTVLLSVSGKARLIALLMWMRLVAGGIAILAAIAVVVFWSIESTERGARDLDLTWNLLAALGAGWAGFWGFGWLANRLHRATFNRVHPKFDT